MDPEQLQALVRKELNRLRGRTAGFVEACNLSARQERGIISTVKSFSYDAESAIVEAIQESVNNEA